VVGADKTGAHDAHPDPFHQHPPEAVVGTVIIYQGPARISGLKRVFPAFRMALQTSRLSGSPACQNVPDRPILKPGGG
jgi:hypothetical protein